jgi:hypothetical protein
MASRDLRRVAALAYDGLGTFEFGIVVELFGSKRTGLDVTWYEFQVCSVERGQFTRPGAFKCRSGAGCAPSNKRERS